MASYLFRNRWFRLNTKQTSNIGEWTCTEFASRQTLNAKHKKISTQNPFPGNSLRKQRLFLKYFFFFFEIRRQTKTIAANYRMSHAPRNNVTFWTCQISVPPLVPGSSTRSVFENHPKSSQHNHVYAKSRNSTKCGRKLISGSSPITRVSYFIRPTSSYNRRYLCFLICLTRKSSKKKSSKFIVVLSGPQYQCLLLCERSKKSTTTSI